jgi:hypothetical protein
MIAKSVLIFLKEKPSSGGGVKKTLFKGMVAL